MKLIVSIVALLLSQKLAWAQSAQQMSEGQNPEKQKAQEQVETLVTDNALERAVVEELAHDPIVSLFGLEVEVENAVVTLTGEASTLLESERAVRVAQTVKGVSAVINRIQIKPKTNIKSDQLKQKIKDALLLDPATEAYQVEVSVQKGGEVTLGGTVDSWPEKWLAETTVKAVPGVMVVHNEINVDVQDTRTDEEIREEIVQRIEWDVLVGELPIDVKVKEGRVTLSGTVGSASAKAQAIFDAWVAGVKNIDADQLEIKAWAKNPEKRTGSVVLRSENELKEAVTRALRYDPRIPEEEIRVSVNNQNVTLRGTVEYLGAKQFAEATAKNVVGVIKVENQISVKGKEVADSVIKERIEQALRENIYLDNNEVKVKVSDGEATLSGAVDTYFEWALAGNLAARVRGVKEITNNTLVADVDSIVVYDPYVDWWPVFDEEHLGPDMGRSKSELSDREIRVEIYNQFWWSPFVDSNEISVEVENGKATLSGMVDSLREAQAAVENAYEGGARLVQNDLQIVGQEQESQ